MKQKINIILICIFILVLFFNHFLSKKENVWLFFAMILLVIIFTGTILQERTKNDQVQIIAWKKKFNGGFTCVKIYECPDLLGG